MEKDKPALPDKDDLREDYRRDPDGFKERFGIPDDPSIPPPPSGDPHRRDN